MKFAIKKVKGKIRWMIVGRAQGKSTKMIQWLHEDPHRVCITPNVQMAEQLWHDAVRMDMPISIRQVHSVSQVKNGSLQGMAVTGVGIDNLDLVLPQLLRISSYPIELVTATGEIV